MVAMNKGECLYLTPIGNPGSAIRDRADAWFSKIVAPAITGAGYVPLRADKLLDTGSISIQIFKHLVDDPMVVADLTDGNPNVYYELAVRHATRKPAVHLIRRGDLIPFHVATLRAVIVDDSEVETLQTSQSDLSQAILFAEHQRHDYGSPLAVALGEWQLSANRNAVPRQLVESLVLWYLHLSFAVSGRGLPERCLRCFQAREEVVGIEATLHELTERLGMPAPNTFRELEKYQWDILNGHLETPRKIGVEISKGEYEDIATIKGTGVQLSKFFTAVTMFLEWQGFFKKEPGLDQFRVTDLFEFAEELLLATAKPSSRGNESEEPGAGSADA